MNLAEFPNSITRRFRLFHKMEGGQRRYKVRCDCGGLSDEFAMENDPVGDPIKEDWIDWPESREFVRNHICK